MRVQVVPAERDAVSDARYSSSWILDSGADIVRSDVKQCREGAEALIRTYSL